MARCEHCGGVILSRDAYSGSPNLSWLVCGSCGRMRAVFAGERDWKEWDMPVKMVDGCVVVPFEMLK